MTSLRDHFLKTYLIKVKCHKTLPFLKGWCLLIIMIFFGHDFSNGRFEGDDDGDDDDDDDDN